MIEKQTFVCVGNHLLCKRTMCVLGVWVGRLWYCVQVWQKKKKTNGVEFLLEVISMGKNAQTKEMIKL